jgi:hypothetical protein
MSRIISGLLLEYELIYIYRMIHNLMLHLSCPRDCLVVRLCHVYNLHEIFHRECHEAIIVGQRVGLYITSHEHPLSYIEVPCAPTTHIALFYIYNSPRDMFIGIS